jgi:dipeptidyl aminopeptidase/acylaminoacyl peptidase
MDLGQRAIVKRSYLLIGVLVAAIVIVGGYFGAAVLVYDSVSRVEPHCDGRFSENTPAQWSPPSWVSAEFDPGAYFLADYDEVRLPARDAPIELHAWWVPASAGIEGPTVIVLHGLGSCIRDREVLLPAGMLSHLGYGVLMLDVRDHGESSVEDGRMAGGTEEYRDVMAAVDWLISRGVDPDRIGVLGTSMGAATAIVAGGEDERISAVWADTSYADLETRIAEELDARGFPRLFAPAAVLVARVVAGDDYSSHPILAEIADMGERRVFITHGALDETTFVSHADALIEAAQAAGVPVETWIVEDAGHVHAMFLHPDDYQLRLDGFFGDALAG